MHRITLAVLSVSILAVSAGAQSTWTGAASTAWNDPANWSAGVPTPALSAIVPPTSNSPSTNGVVAPSCASLTVQSGATLVSPGGFPLLVQGSVTCGGQVNGELRLVGSGTAATTGSGLIDTLRIAAGPYTLTDVHLGTLDQLPGAQALTVQTCSVAGNSSFRGAGLIGASGSLLDCGGSITVQTTVPVTAPPATIHLTTVWTSDSSWQPASGTVVFTGGGGTIAVVAPNTVWRNLEVEALFGLTVQGDLRVGGALRMRSDLRVNGAVVDLTQPVGITINSELTGNSVTQLRIRNGVTSAGIIDLPNAVLDADGNLTFFVTGLLSLGNGTHRISNSAGIAGGFVVPPASTIELDGSGTFTVAPFNVLSNVRVTGTSYTILDATIGGNLELAVGAGDLNIGRCVVNGNCTLRGNSLAGVGVDGGGLDVNGNMDWQTVAVVNAPPAAISCAGSWIASATFQPTSGLVLFDGVGAKSVTMPQFHWHSLRIAPTTSISTPLAVSTTGLLDVRGSLQSGGGDVESFGALTVSGALTASSSLRLRAHVGMTITGSVQMALARLDVDGDTSIDGSLTLGNGNHGLTGSLHVGGSMVMPAGQLAVFDGSGTVDVVAGNPLPNVRFAGGDYTVQSLVVTQDLTHVGGTLSVHSCAVQRHATLQGAGLTDSDVGLLDVDGNVAVALASPATAPPSTIRCAGNWVSNTSWAPTQGLVVLDGAAPQTVTMATLPWFDLRIAAGAQVSQAVGVSVHGALDVRGQLVSAGTTVQVDGAMMVAGTGALTVAAATSVQCGSAASILGLAQFGGAAMSVQGGLLVANPGVLAIGAGPHQLHSGLQITGNLTVPPTAVFQFVGSGAVDVLPAVPLPQVSFTSGPYSVTRLIVSGSLTQTGGLMLVRNLVVAGNAQFAGAGLSDLSLGVLDVRGNIDVSTTGVVTVPPSRIKFGGNWTCNPQFVPTSGVVEANGSAPQVMGGTQLLLSNLEVAVASQLSFGLPNVILQGDLFAAGQLLAPSALLEIRNNATVAPTGVVAIDNGSVVTIGKSLSNAGAIQAGTGGAGTVRMVGDGSVAGAGQFLGLEVNSPSQVAFLGSLALGGNLRVLAGEVSLAPAAQLVVQGDLLATGGTLFGSASAEIDVHGAASLAGLAAVPGNVPNLRCRGDYAASNTFAPTSGSVLLDGSGALSSLAGGLQFALLQVVSGTRAVQGDFTVTAQQVNVQGAAVLDVAGRSLGLVAPQISVTGRLSVGAGGEVVLGPAATMLVPGPGHLQLLGTFDSPARIDGTAGSGYSLQINGRIEAMNYEFAHMGPAGVRVNAGAIIAPSPHDLRAGRFVDGSAAPGSCLLHIDRNAPTQLRYPRFDDAGTATFNVRSTGAAQVAIVNERGSFAAPSREDDPGGVIDWLPAEHTLLDEYSARAAVHRAELVFTTGSEIDVQRFRIMRALAAGGPFAEIPVGLLPPSGTPTTGATYQGVDFNTIDTTRYFYRLEEVLLHGEPRQLGSDFARPWPQTTGNTWFVGTNGGYPDIAAAVAAAAPGGNIVVQAGTYPAFTLNKAVRILPDGSGPVRIDTALQAFIVRDIPASAQDLAIYDLQVGSPGSPFGMQVINCDNVILLDRLQVAAATGVPGLLVDDSTQMAIQSCGFAGDPGLKFDSASACYLSRGSADELELAGSSRVTVCNLVPGTTTVAPGSLLTPAAGVMPDVRMTGAWAGDKPVRLTIATDVSSFYGLLFSVRRDYLDLSLVFPIDMVLLIEHSQAVVFATGFVPSGSVELSLQAPGLSNLWGLQVPLQLFELKTSGNGRMSNSRDIVLLP